MYRLAQRRFLGLLVSLLLLVIVYPIFQEAVSTRLIFDFLVTAVFVMAIRSIFTERRERIVVIALGIPTLVGIWLDYAHDGQATSTIAVVFHLVATVFHLFVMVTILRIIHRESRVTVDAICGAFCGYLLIGLAFGQLYCVVDAFHPDAFQGTSGAANLDRRQVLVYYSYITLTTVGYGDITPVRGSARSLAMAEALVGQFYVAGFVAELIGKRVAQILSEPAKPESTERGSES